MLMSIASRRNDLLPPETIMVSLKVAVVAVTLLLLASLVALARGNYRLHGRLNLVFFILTLSALGGLEIIARVLEPQMFDEYIDSRQARTWLDRHLMFSMPAAVILPFMLFTGLRHRRGIHLALAAVFGILWAGTFVTGVFFLPHR